MVWHMLISSTCLGIAIAVNILQWALKRKEAFISPVVKENYLVKLIQKSFEETIHEERISMLPIQKMVLVGLVQS